MASKEVGGVLWSQSASASFPNVNVGLRSACRDKLCSEEWTKGEWTMRLQRKSGTGWKTVGTRTGYVSMSSSSNRKFSNVKKQGEMRVHTTIKNSTYHPSVTLTDTIK